MKIIMNLKLNIFNLNFNNYFVLIKYIIAHNFFSVYDNFFNIRTKQNFETTLTLHEKVHFYLDFVLLFKDWFKISDLKDN